MKKVRAGVLRMRRRVEQEMLWVVLVKVKRAHEQVLICSYCGNCLTLVTRGPVKRTKTVLEGGWP
jgi:hypothetical protein